MLVYVFPGLPTISPPHMTERNQCSTVSPTSFVRYERQEGAWGLCAATLIGLIRQHPSRRNYTAIRTYLLGSQNILRYWMRVDSEWSCHRCVDGPNHHTRTALTTFCHVASGWLEVSGPRDGISKPFLASNGEINGYHTSKLLSLRE